MLVKGQGVACTLAMEDLGSGLDSAYFSSSTKPTCICRRWTTCAASQEQVVVCDAQANQSWTAHTSRAWQIPPAAGADALRALICHMQKMQRLRYVARACNVACRKGSNCTDDCSSRSGGARTSQLAHHPRSCNRPHLAVDDLLPQAALGLPAGIPVSNQAIKLTSLLQRQQQQQ